MPCEAPIPFTKKHVLKHIFDFSLDFIMCFYRNVISLIIEKGDYVFLI